MNITYKIASKFYDLIDVFYFTSKGVNPRKAILKIIPDKQVSVLDMCCGTMSNSIGIARERRNAKIYGIDSSSDMLQIAKEKIRKNDIKNISIRKCDATHTGICDEKFDFIIIALVLHELDEEVAGAMLKEAHRLLKTDGKLIVLEWEKSENILKKIMFFPIQMMEPKSFKKFFYLNKDKYFEEKGFKVIQKYHCDYSCVYEMYKKR